MHAVESSECTPHELVLLFITDKQKTRKKMEIYGKLSVYTLENGSHNQLQHFN